MIIKYLQEKDVERLREIHKKLGFDYTFPKLDEFFPIPSVVDDQNRPVMAVASLPTVELFMFVDSEWETPGMRMEAFKNIHEFVRRDLRARGIVEANAWLPPEADEAFGRRLTRMGWDRNRNWSCFSRRTDHV